MEQLYYRLIREYGGFRNGELVIKVERGNSPKYLSVYWSDGTGRHIPAEYLEPAWSEQPADKLPE